MYGHSVLILSSNQKAVREEVLKIVRACGIPSLKNADVTEIGSGERSIGIDSVRKVGPFLAKRPLKSKKKVLIIYNAANLSHDAQNSLLKTLEEPNPSTQIILIAEKENGILSTILSRCQKLKLRADYSPEKALEELAIKFMEGRVGERLHLIEANKDVFTQREEAVKFIDALCFVIRKDLSRDKLDLINKALKIQKDLESTNVNVRLAIEYLAIT
ncbi:hypothetical protein HY419_01935 [candidate division WWE3 bacterium]|nr:hypothetical protein [candidate division WWE3 bacterium]